MVYRINPEGCLYGITFIDHTTRTVFNGSRLGKAFSANVFNELFNNPDADRIRLIPLAQQDTPRLEREERPEDAEYRQQENQGYNQSELSGSLIDTSALVPLTFSPYSWKMTIHTSTSIRPSASDAGKEKAQAQVIIK